VKSSPVAVRSVPSRKTALTQIAIDHAAPRRQLAQKVPSRKLDILTFFILAPCMILAKARTIAMRPIKLRSSSSEKIERLIRVNHLPDVQAVDAFQELITPHPAALCVGL